MLSLRLLLSFCVFHSKSDLNNLKSWKQSGIVPFFPFHFESDVVKQRPMEGKMFLGKDNISFNIRYALKTIIT